MKRELKRTKRKASSTFVTALFRRVFRVWLRHEGPPHVQLAGLGGQMSLPEAGCERSVAGKAPSCSVWSLAYYLRACRDRPESEWGGRDEGNELEDVKHTHTHTHIHPHPSTHTHTHTLTLSHPHTPEEKEAFLLSWTDSSEHRAVWRSLVCLYEHWMGQDVGTHSLPWRGSGQKEGGTEGGKVKV